MNINLDLSLKFFNDFSNEGVGALPIPPPFSPPGLILDVMTVFVFFFLLNSQSTAAERLN